jgi:hypothetical protein
MAAARANQENAKGEQEVDADGVQEAATDGEQEVDVDGELDAVEIFKVCHTSREKGVTDTTKEAIVSLISLYAFPTSFYVSLIETVLVWKLIWLEKLKCP